MINIFSSNLPRCYLHKHSCLSILIFYENPKWFLKLLKILTTLNVKYIFSFVYKTPTSKFQTIIALPWTIILLIPPSLGSHSHSLIFSWQFCVFCFRSLLYINIYFLHYYIKLAATNINYWVTDTAYSGLINRITRLLS